MIYPVKVFNGTGALKQVISSERLSQIHWQIFEEREAKASQTIPVRNRSRKWIKKIGRSLKNNGKD